MIAATTVVSKQHKGSTNVEVTNKERGEDDDVVDEEEVEAEEIAAPVPVADENAVPEGTTTTTVPAAAATATGRKELTKSPSEATRLRRKPPMIRNQSEIHPRDPHSRRMERLRQAFGGASTANLQAQTTANDAQHQYRLSADQKTTYQSPATLSICGHSVNDLVLNYIHWSFRSSFGAVFLSGATVFLTLTFLFAIVFWAISQRFSDCMGGGIDPDSWTDAFILSWTTFSTVGYGLVYAPVSPEAENIKDCTGITILLTMESFVGVLYAGMVGAILFAKVARIQSFAQVQFSDPMVIRYGTGVEIEQDFDEEEGQARHDDKHLPAPILEFRIMNNLSEVPGGEIVDANINIVASIDTHQAPPVEHAHHRKKKKGKRRGPGPGKIPPTVREDSDQPQGPVDEKALITNMVQDHGAAESLNASATDPSRMLCKLDVETSEHPFFKRVWVVRHHLDQNSPLIKHHTRHLMKHNQGFWPKSLNSAEGIHAAIHFHQIMVVLSGTSNADANSVYAQKVYEFMDVYIGYRFVSALFRDDDGGLILDKHLINDIVEQSGGGGEPLVQHVSNVPDPHENDLA